MTYFLEATGKEQSIKTMPKNSRGLQGLNNDFQNTQIAQQPGGQGMLWSQRCYQPLWAAGRKQEAELPTEKWVGRPKHLSQTRF